MIGSEKITFSPVFIARCSSRIRSAGMPASTIAALMIMHSDCSEPGVTPPLTIDQRKKPSRHSRAAVSTRSATSSRVPNRNSKSAGWSGVSIRWVRLISAISSAVGRRVLRFLAVIAARCGTGARLRSQF